MKNTLIALLLLFSNAFSMNPQDNPDDQKPSRSNTPILNSQDQDNQGIFSDKVQQIINDYLIHKRGIFNEISGIFHTYLPEFKKKFGVDFQPENLLTEELLAPTAPCYIQEDSIIFPLYNVQNYPEYSVKVIYHFEGKTSKSISAGLFSQDARNSYILQMGEMFFYKGREFFTGIFDNNQYLCLGVRTCSEINIVYFGEFLEDNLFNGKILARGAPYAFERKLAESHDQNHLILTSSVDMPNKTYINDMLNIYAIKAAPVQKIVHIRGKKITLRKNISIHDTIKIIFDGVFNDSKMIHGSIAATYETIDLHYRSSVANQLLCTYTKIGGFQNNPKYGMVYTDDALEFIRLKIYSQNAGFHRCKLEIVDCQVRCSKHFGLLNDPNAIINITLMLDNDQVKGHLLGIYAGFPISFQWHQ